MFNLWQKIIEANEALQLEYIVRDPDFNYVKEYFICLKPVADTIDKL